MKRLLRIVLALIALLVVILGVTLLYVLIRWDHPDDRRAPVMVALRDPVTVARGEHLFKDCWQCWGCHAMPPADANTVPSGGLAFDLRKTGPGLGIFYGTNLTPDSTTGIGAWTDGELVQAIREGVGRNRRVLFPIMSEYMYGLSDSDALAIVAYMRSLPPVKHAVPHNEPSFVLKAIFAIGLIKPRPVLTAPVTAPPPGPTEAYGRYFANHAAGCADWAFDDARLAFEATLALARDAKLLQDARRRLAAARSSALFDAAGFARAFEALIERAVAAPA